MLVPCGIVESIKSISLLKDQYSDVVLYLLGDGESFEMLTKVILWNLGFRIRVILHVQTRPTMLESSSLCAMLG